MNAVAKILMVIVIVVVTIALILPSWVNNSSIYADILTLLTPESGSKVALVAQIEKMIDEGKFAEAFKKIEGFQITNGQVPPISRNSLTKLRQHYNNDPEKEQKIEEWFQALYPELK